MDTAIQVTAESSQIDLDGIGLGRALFIAANTGAVTVSVTLSVLPDNGAAPAWFTVDQPPDELKPGALVVVMVTVQVSQGTPVGQYRFAATAGGQPSGWVGFHYGTAPAVTAVSPATGRGAGGDAVRVTGSGFLGATAVNFGAVRAANLVVEGDSLITVTSPAQSASGAVHVTVTTPGGTSATSAADRFTYTWAAPAVAAISPAIGRVAGGDTVRVTGSGFLGATAVNFGAVRAANPVVEGDSSITVTSPAQSASGAVDVTVTTPGGTSATSAADKFTYVAPLIVITSSLPAATCGSPYTQGQLRANGGLAPIIWSLAGSLPRGLSLDAEGQIVGTPSASQPEPSSFAVVATDATGGTASSRPLTIHLVGRQEFFTNVAKPIDQDSSGQGDITRTYTFPAPPGTQIVTSTVNIDPQPDTQRPSGPWNVSNRSIFPNVVQFDVFTSAAGGFPIGHHSGHVVVVVSFTYQTV